MVVAATIMLHDTVPGRHLYHSNLSLSLYIYIYIS